MYDYWLGGRDNYEVDREAAEQVLATQPRLVPAVRENRAFLRRAVRAVAREGVRQFLDIGTGIPTSPNTHEVAQAVHPGARVVYVDNDPIVGLHAYARLGHGKGTAFALADLHDPADILAQDAVASLIDFDEPVALLLVAVLHFISDARDPAGIVATLRDALPPGSFLVASHVTADKSVHDLATAEKVYESTTAGLTLRTHAQVLRFFEGFEMIDPGLVSVDEWRPDFAQAEPASYGIYGGVGRKA
jgi:hypothetical protein